MTVALYMRMSTDKQENSIESQRKILEAYALSNKLKIVGEYIDEGISGRQADKRPAFLRMIEDSSKELFNSVLVYDSSRFARNLEESIVYKSVLKRNGVKLISATEPALDDDSALITDAMLGALNEMYSRKLSKSVKRGMVHYAQKGIYPVPPPFGYTKADGIMTVDENQANTVRDIFNSFINGSGYYTISMDLNLRGVPKKTLAKWQTRDVKRITRNTAYIGKVQYDGVIYNGNHERIISDEVWEKAQDLIKSRPKYRARPGSTYKHWLSGVLVCSNCGSKMVFNYRPKLAYRCKGYVNGACTESNHIAVKDIEELFKATLVQFISMDEGENYFPYITKKNNDDELASLKSRLKKLRQKLVRFKDAYAAGIDTLEEYKENKSKIIQEESDIKEKIRYLEDVKTTSDKVNDIKSKAVDLLSCVFDENIALEKKSNAVKSIIDKIVVDRNAGSLEVYYFL